jgi:DNA replication protein DnaC
MLNELSPIKRYWVTKNANIPIRYLGWSKDKIVESSGRFAPEVDDWIDLVLAGDVIKKPGSIGTTGVGLLFDGDPGLGKTTYATVAAMELVRRMSDNEDDAAKLLVTSKSEFGYKFRAIHYLTYPEYLHIRRSAFDADIDERRELNRLIDGFHGRSKEDYLNVRVLVIDDLGKEHKTSWNESQFDELLRSRYDKGLPTLITTNVVRENWATVYGEAMGSFVYEAFQQIKLKGKDLRLGE